MKQTGMTCGTASKQTAQLVYEVQSSRRIPGERNGTWNAIGKTTETGCAEIVTVRRTGQHS